MLAGKLKAMVATTLLCLFAAAVVALGAWMVATFFSMLLLHRAALWTFVAGGTVYLAAFAIFFRWLYPGMRNHFTGQSKWEASSGLR
ncbi:MAG TPA: hypothetical protein VE825_02800 [Terriglobales bacterium]|jgi:ABC-type multidrug transport system fused ATPase/permease subunit|nr:hypothetical protein [Terriglobales bacterium]